jgi:hypothetical protein
LLFKTIVDARHGYWDMHEGRKLSVAVREEPEKEYYTS